MKHCQISRTVLTRGGRGRAFVSKTLLVCNRATMIVLIIAATSQDETMARKVFFSFHCALDSWRATQVRNSVVVSRYEKSFYDKAKWESIKRQGDDNVRRWIDL